MSLFTDKGLRDTVVVQSNFFLISQTCTCFTSISFDFVVPLQACGRKDCSNHGEFVDHGPSFRCDCDDGYFGQRLLNACIRGALEGRGYQNGAGCGNFPSGTGFSCACKGYWKGEFCDTPIPKVIGNRGLLLNVMVKITDCNYLGWEPMPNMDIRRWKRIK